MRYLFFLIFVSSSAFASDNKDWIDRLCDAVIQVESSGNPLAFHEEEQAAGIVQIRPICLEDCNRIAKEERWTLDDRWDVGKSKEMFRLYVTHYTRNIKGDKTEAAARIWNGGPSGHKKTNLLRYKRTGDYWRKVKKELKG